jgi:hypothetical protein
MRLKLNYSPANDGAPSRRDEVDLGTQPSERHIGDPDKDIFDSCNTPSVLPRIRCRRTWAAKITKSAKDPLCFRIVEQRVFKSFH